MKFIGFNYDKISIEKLNENVRGEKINAHTDISSIEQLNSKIFGGTEKIIKVKFSYNIKYDPDFVVINFKGSVLFSAEESEAKIVLDKWEKKEIEEKFKVSLFNIILRKANIKALQLEDEFAIPPHIHLPSVKAEDKKE